MSFRKLSRMGLDADVVQRLAMRNIHTPKDLLAKTELDLMETVDIPLREIQELVRMVSQSICPTPTTLLHLFQRRQEEKTHLFTNLPALDQNLRGGVPMKGITELVGPAGVGKTQMCQMLAVLGALPLALGGLGGNIMYIDTENKFSSARLVEIACTRFPSHFQTPSSHAALSSQVLVVNPPSSDAMHQHLTDLETTVIKKNIKLIIVDSIAALLRAEFSSANLIQRQELLGQQAARLKFLSESFSIPVIVTNQVTTSFNRGPANSGFGFEQQGRSGARQGTGGDEEAGNIAAESESHLTAALGTKWAHCVNTRLVLEATHSYRSIKVAKSPEAPMISLPYMVTSKGIELTNAHLSDPQPSSAPGGGGVVGMEIRNQRMDVISLGNRNDTDWTSAPEEAPVSVRYESDTYQNYHQQDPRSFHQDYHQNPGHGVHYTGAWNENSGQQVYSSSRYDINSRAQNDQRSTAAAAANRAIDAALGHHTGYVNVHDDVQSLREDDVPTQLN
mmetsp:Transcript_13067/g.15767  ORF Transcript_13067/g.15767 Transcript_13067/m.15767 type:complete len:505 (+) Transcript_13067:671-2185(+)|eukprot:CAMPEP_0197855714 /NCGR_PEP_ID=MMETSP1438-20131217/27119_1 /TAXON_ID=1461541 /ORGANISM="Pterosperma sp., Strain CCMP1384" /LENGTH=504 /DNA_ID=CAMNT_0043470915 /DNA_START=442 /DNA_END=1956 /DNA_ORIENTATION=-